METKIAPLGTTGKLINVCGPGSGSSELFAGYGFCQGLLELAPYWVAALQFGIIWSMTLAVFRRIRPFGPQPAWVPHAFGLSIGLGSIGGWTGQLTSLMTAAMLGFAAVVGAWVSRWEVLTNLVSRSPALSVPAGFALVGLDALLASLNLLVDVVPFELGVSLYALVCTVSVAGLGRAALAPTTGALASLGLPGERILLFLMVGGAVLILPYEFEWVGWLVAAAGIAGTLMAFHEGQTASPD